MRQRAASGVTTTTAMNSAGLAAKHSPSECDAERLADAALGLGPAPRAAAAGSSVSAETSVPDHAVQAAHHAVIRGGAPLSRQARAEFEPRFGVDLSSVRIHAEGEAARAATAIGAQAYTLGDHVALSSDAPSFASSEGRALLAHELAHVVLHRDAHSPVIHRRPARNPATSEEKPQVIAIEAVMDEKQGTATLSEPHRVLVPEDGTAPLKLSKNDLPPGTHVLNHEGNGKYTSAAPIVDPKNPKRSTWAFIWINPYLPGTKEVRYAWAPSVTVTITLTAGQRIARLPAHIRNALTTDKGEKAGADEVEEVARAGELLEQADVTAQDMILYDEQIKAAHASGADIAEVDAVDFARSLVGRRAQQQQQSVPRLDELVAISKLLADEPLYTLGYGGLDSVLDPGNDKNELAVALRIYTAYKALGRTGGFEKLDVAGQRKFLHELVVGFRTLLLRFEQALLADLRALANTALDAAEASILLMDKRFTGIWQEVVPGPGFLKDELDRVNQSEPIVRATDERIEATAVIDREEIIDKKKLYQGYFGPSLNEVVAHVEREEQRDEHRKQVEAAFEDAVRKNSDLKLPPGKSARQILDADAHTAVTLLRDYLYDGREKIRAARSKISEDKVLYAAEIWIKAEQERSKAALGAQRGGEIAVLIDRFASLRKSQTSPWEDLLRIVEFVSMFVPGPIGWGLRAGTAIIGAHEALSQQYTQGALYGAGGSNVQASSGALAVGNALVNMIPDAGMFAKGAGVGERMAAQGLEHAGAGAADDAAKLAGQALDDTATAGGHAATEGAETAAKIEIGERVATEGAETTVKTEERTAAASGREHTETTAQGDTPKTETAAQGADVVASDAAKAHPTAAPAVSLEAKARAELEGRLAKAKQELEQLDRDLAEASAQRHQQITAARNKGAQPFDLKQLEQQTQKNVAAKGTAVAGKRVEVQLLERELAKGSKGWRQVLMTSESSTAEIGLYGELETSAKFAEHGWEPIGKTVRPSDIRTPGDFKQALRSYKGQQGIDCAYKRVVDGKVQYVIADSKATLEELEELATGRGKLGKVRDQATGLADVDQLASKWIRDRLDKFGLNDADTDAIQKALARHSRGKATDELTIVYAQVRGENDVQLLEVELLGNKEARIKGRFSP